MKTKLGDINKETVLEAYEKMHLEPKFGTWGNGETCACAVVAFLAHKDPEALDTIREIDGLEICGTLAKRLGVPTILLRAFTDGFDNFPMYSLTIDEFSEGLAVRKAVKERYPDA